MQQAQQAVVTHALGDKLLDCLELQRCVKAWAQTHGDVSVVLGIQLGGTGDCPVHWQCHGPNATAPEVIRCLKEFVDDELRSQSARPTTECAGRLKAKCNALHGFIDAAAVSGILSGVQVKLLLGLAADLCSVAGSGQSGHAQMPSAQEPAATFNPVVALQASQQSAAATIRAVHTQQMPFASSSANLAQLVSSLPPLSGGLPTQPQLQIQPLSLNSTLAPLAVTLPKSQPANTTEQQPRQQAACTPNFTGGTAAAAAANRGLAGTEGLQDAQVSMAAASAAGTSDSQAARPAAGLRKNRFTREQQLAILESVERNYALCPSRYTELVIKEMQDKFPGIEINNACVRKIKFRASETIKQGSSSRRDSQSAVDAAEGLVGLAAAAESADANTSVAHTTATAAAGACVSCIDEQGVGPFGAVVAAVEQCKYAAKTEAVQATSPLEPSSEDTQEHIETSEQQFVPHGLRAIRTKAQSQLQAVKAQCDDAVDSATAAAAEAMHMLASSAQTFEETADTTACGQLKRKFEEIMDTHVGSHADVAATSNPPATGIISAQPTATQIADALAAAASLAPALPDKACLAAAAAAGTPIHASQQQQAVQQLAMWPGLTAVQSAPAGASGISLGQFGLSVDAGLNQLQPAPIQWQPQPQQAASAVAAPPAAAIASTAAPPAKRQRLTGVQMAELVASVRHHVQANPERYTHFVIKDMKEKYPDLELNMGQIRKIKFRTLGNSNMKQGGKPADEDQSRQDGNMLRSAHPGGAAAGPGLQFAAAGITRASAAKGPGFMGAWPREHALQPLMTAAAAAHAQETLGIGMCT